MGNDASVKRGMKYVFRRCKICDGPITVLERNTVDGLKVAKCTDCGFLFVKDIPYSTMWMKDDVGRIERRYAHTVGQIPQKFYYGLDEIEKFLKSRSENQAKEFTLLDVGCGNGNFLLLCKERGFVVKGIEQSKSATEVCRRRGLDCVYNKDIDEIDDVFDVITLFDVAEHLEDPRTFFGKIYERLKPKGVLFMETPRKSVLDIYLRVLSMATPVRSNRISRAHLQLYSDTSLLSLLKHNKFNIVSFERRQSLSWANKKQYIRNLNIRSRVAVAILEKASYVAIKLGVLGRNKAVILAQK